MIACLLLSQFMLTNAYWGHALLHAVKLRNRQMNNKSAQIGDGVTPDEAMKNRKPDIDSLQFALLRAASHCLKAEQTEAGHWSSIK